MQEKIINRNYSYIFWISVFLVITGVLWGNGYIIIFAFLISPVVILAIQLKSGYALNRAWILNISRNEHPYQYWISIMLDITFILGFVFYIVYKT